MDYYSSARYEINGNKIEFKCDIDVCRYGDAYMDYTNNKLTIRCVISLDNVLEDTICTWDSLDTIVYLKQEVEYSNGTFGSSKIIEKGTLKEYVK